MNLDQPSEKNLKFILEELTKKLNVVNQRIMEPDEYDIDKYNDIKQMYDLIMARRKLSPSETQAFVDELRFVRKDT
ncbi:MAG TPA: DUF1128 domain-containing protein [Candidatus Avamphibacillus sp.]|nr:DUF1128 domain-containing protein [Candidatus Avamphibacillus sp.]